MAITKPPVLPAWAESGDRVTPSNAEIQVGWPLSSIPPSRQRFNWLLNFLANGVRYFTRRGLPDYDAAETYMIGDRIIGDDGKTYRSLIDTNLAQTPSTSPTKWERWALTLAEMYTSLTTPAQFDSTVKPATTAFVQRALGNDSALIGITANITLTAAHAGSFIEGTGASAYTATLPLASTCPSGTKISLICSGSGVLTVARQGSDNIITPVFGTITSLSLALGDSAFFESNGTGWYLFGGSAALRYSSGDFGSSIASSGYQKLPSGLIIQWGQATANASGAATIATLPVTFPSINLWASVCATNGNASSVTAWVDTLSASNFTFHASAQVSVLWMAIGK